MTDAAPATTVRDADWYVANANRSKELHTEAERLMQIADAAVRAANDAVNNADAVDRVSEMFEGHPLLIDEVPNRIDVRSLIERRSAVVYRGQGSDTTWSVNFKGYVRTEATDQDRIPVGNASAHDLTLDDAIDAAKRWVAQGTDPR